MDKNIYSIIKKYCTTDYNQVLSQAEKDYILRMFLDSYYAAIEKYTKLHNAAPTPNEEQTIFNSIFNQSTLLSYGDSAKSYYQRLKNNIENDFRKKQVLPSFLKSIAISLLANLAYSIILLILFFVAKDQITIWFLQLGL